MYKYFKEIENGTRTAYSVAEEARKKGLDPKSVVEIKIATNLAQRAIGLIASKYPQVQNEKIERRIKELEKEHGFLDHAVCLKIAEEIAKERFCKFKDLHEAIDAGIRVAFAYYTLGVVVPPLEGFTHFEIKKTRNGKDFFAAYYSGPIRSAGVTAAFFSLVIVDYLREVFGYAKYDPTEIETKRGITEVYDYHERVTNLQYLATPEEIKLALSNVPIQIDGLPTEEREVSNYKDLERIETNRIRGGFCLILSESLCQKVPKYWKIIIKLRNKGFKLSGWDFLEKLIELKEKIQEKKKKQEAAATYIQDAVAGRPIFGHPSRSGAFRLCYGRCRFSGYSAAAINPATMKIFDDFIAVGTQLKLERPTKGASITVCDDIDGPIIKLEDDSVVEVKTLEQAEEVKDKIKEIIYSGDLLVSYGDFINRNHPLLPCGYNPDWWLTELKAIAVKYGDPEKLAGKSPEELEKIQNLLKNIDKKNVSIENAIKISDLFRLPLHSNFIFYWSQINFEQFLSLIEWFSESNLREGKLNLPYETHRREKFSKAKRTLELLGIEHQVTTANVVVESIITKALAVNLDVNLENFLRDSKNLLEKARKKNKSTKVLDFVNKTSRFKIKDKAGSFIGARMGRPEKAKPRELTGSPHVLFPVGEQGGRLRSFQAAIKEGYVEADFPLYYCENCKKETIYFICENCKKKTRKIYYCPECIKKIHTENCPLHGKAMSYSKTKLDIKHYFDAATKQSRIRNEGSVLVKGVRGTSSKDHTPENLAKGILRAAFNLHVNKDGTIRYDSSEVPMTQFKPKEANVSIEKLKELGYFKDINGRELKDKGQILELKPHDVILPCLPHSSDEPANETFFRVSKFMDALLVNFYGMKPFYDLKCKEDLIGHLLLCEAPHNCAGVVGRIIGFSNTQGFFASPYMHAAMRRDCDGDEAAMMLLLDALINFSREYLPAHRGATQDSPLILNSRIRAQEVDDMIFDMDVVKNYPLELYMAAEKSMMPNTVKIEQISDRLKDEELFSAFKNLYYTHETSNLNDATLCNSYKTLITMQDKVNHQMALAEKLRAVDTADVARLVIERHFIRDIKGNFHKFTRQRFRCVKCNEKYRRPPLSGKCRCGGRIIFTIAEGSIIKYLEPAIQLAKKYGVSDYVKQSLDLVKQAIESIFGKETEKQQELKQWF
ncbi:MAG: DNA polymerase II large subunit [Candidatus Pacearchaeota archaeon]|nr:MAG: DNA polymerase II large subunit [Candidatus Pacearchaeota archaeon]